MNEKQLRILKVMTLISSIIWLTNVFMWINKNTSVYFISCAVFGISFGRFIRHNEELKRLRNGK